MTPKIIVTVDDSLTDERAHWLKRGVDEWITAGGGPLILAAAGVHAAVQQPDGTWVRICHEHPEPASVDEAELVGAEA